MWRWLVLSLAAHSRCSVSPEQAARNRDIEVTGIPEFPGEDLCDIILQLGDTLGLRSPCIMEAVRERAGKLAQESRPDHVIATLPEASDKKKWIDAAKKYYYLTAQEIDPTFEPRPITIEEYLVPATKRLLAFARCFAKQHQYQYVWTEDGVLFMRRNNNSERFAVWNERDIDKLPSDPIFK